MPVSARGMALVETLIAALVFGIGLAGIATLLVLGLRTQREAARESGAATLLTGIGEEIRALTGGDAAALAVLGGADLEARCREAPAACERETAAAAADERWQARAGALLGASGSAGIERIEGAAAGYRLRLRWSTRPGEERVAATRIEP